MALKVILVSRYLKLSTYTFSNSATVIYAKEQMLMSGFVDKNYSRVSFDGLYYLDSLCQFR
jgi:hypothetical protein